MTSATSRPVLGNFWPSFEPVNPRGDIDIVEAIYSICASLMQAIVKTIHWIIENRGGFAQLVGFMMVPSQYLCPKAADSNRVVDAAATIGNCTIEKFTLYVADGATTVTGIVYYPEGWDRSDNSRCVLYHNPNGCTVAEYFYHKNLCWTPGEIVALAGCPIVMYDYRGTGLSGSFPFRPTYESIVVDGEAVLRHALGLFASVYVVGSSLGGGVATVSLERRLKAHPEESARVRLANLDSFSTTPRVVMPKLRFIADWTGWLLGGFLDAETSMKSLVQRAIPIAILCHREDPVIPSGARMAEAVETWANRPNVTIIDSHRRLHATLSEGMVSALRSNHFFSP